MIRGPRTADRRPLTPAHAVSGQRFAVSVAPSSVYTQIYAVVRRIPPGRVASYGQVAALTGLPGRARQVGYALHALKLDSVPWHRVINAAGKISLKGPAAITQRIRLEREGVRCDAGGRIDLARYGWRRRV